jgi:hypothetical protein
MTYVRPLGDVDGVVGTAPGGGYTIGDFIGALINTAKGLDTASAADVPTANGTGSTTAADFVARAGGCKPTNLTALTYAKNLQSQLNRVAQVKGFGKIGVDGEIGPGTQALFAKVQTAAGGSQIMGSPSSCMGIAPDVDVLGAQVQGYADSIGAPLTVSPSQLAVKAPTIVRPNGEEVAETGLFGAFGQLQTIEKVAVLGVVGGIGYLLFTAKKKRKARR